LLLHSKEFPPQGRNYGFFQNTKIDELFERGQFVVQPQRRIETYRQIQQLVMEQAPWIFLSDLVRMAGYRKTLTGVEMIGANQGLIDVRRARLGP
jgi:ABC-type transport system substrate-binding protein